MFNGVKEHYNQYYRYNLPSGEEPCAAANRLYDSVMRNDKTALDQLLKILSSNTYYMVCSRLEKAGHATRENVDDVMQNIRMEILKAAFRGFPQYIKKDQLYPYLIGIAEKCVDNFKKTNQGNKNREQYDTEKYSVFDAVQDNKTDSNLTTPEQKVLSDERAVMRNIILKTYITALQESKQPPYQLLTYCYAVLIPQLFKKTVRKELLRKIDSISSRKSPAPNSHYNEEKNCLEGDITRNSTILLNWALSAMYKQTVAELNQEFLDLYKIEKIADVMFEWGIYYRANMEKEYENIPIKQLVITDTFQENAIKNWPERIAKSLLKAAEQILLSQEEFCGKSVKIAEEMLE